MSAEQTPHRPTAPISPDSARPLFISKSKAAAQLDVSPGTIDRLWNDGEIEAINVRGGVKVLVSSLEAYVERQLDEFASNNGYTSPRHREAIRSLGLSSHHRRRIYPKIYRVAAPTPAHRRTASRLGDVAGRSFTKATMPASSVDASFHPR
jgi:hypothetical protein